MSAGFPPGYSQRREGTVVMSDRSVIWLVERSTDCKLGRPLSTGKAVNSLPESVRVPRLGNPPSAGKVFIWFRLKFRKTNWSRPERPDRLVNWFPVKMRYCRLPRPDNGWMVASRLLVKSSQYNALKPRGRRYWSVDSAPGTGRTGCPGRTTAGWSQAGCWSSPARATHSSRKGRRRW